MGFWAYMLVLVLLVPLVMIFFGSRFEKEAPNINTFLAYRTSRSSVNGDTWQYAHKKFGHLCKMFGLIALPISAAVMMITVKMSVDAANILATLIIGIQCIMFFVPVIMTEKDLKTSFDEYGRRTEESLAKEQELESKKTNKKEKKIKKEKVSK